MRRHLRFCADGRRIKRRLSNKKFLLFIGKQYHSAARAKCFSGVHAGKTIEPHSCLYQYSNSPSQVSTAPPVSSTRSSVTFTVTSPP